MKTKSKPRQGSPRGRGYAIGIDLGGSSVKAVGITTTGRVTFRFNTPFDPAAKLAFARTVREMVGQIESQSGRPADWVGVSAPGLAAGNGRWISYMPGRLPGLQRLDWQKFLRRKERVPVLNDAHAALLGEAWIGAGRKFPHAILLTLGTGVGGAILLHGKLWKGHLGRAGHLGHTSLNPAGPPDIARTPGSLESAIGNYNILQRSRGRFQTTLDLVMAYDAGDAFAKTVWEDSLRSLAAGIASFINIIDPQVVIIGGGVARAGRSLFQPMQAFLDEMEWRPGGTKVKVKVVPAEVGEFAGAVGSARNAILSAKQVR